MFTNDDMQQALGFVISQTASIEAGVYRIKYPDIQYPSLIPVDTSANEWAQLVTFFSMDTVGEADWFDHYAKDIPNAEVERAQHNHPISMAAIGYQYTLQEVNVARMIPGTNLNADKASGARRAYEEFMDRIAMTGAADKGWKGLINQTGVTAGNVPADGNENGGVNSPYWIHKTETQILRDVNSLLTGVWVASNTVEMADTLLLPLTEFDLVATRRLGDTTMTVLQFLKENNAYTAQTGRPLTIRAVRGLENAGAGGTSRMIAYWRDPTVLKLHLPMSHRFLPVWQTGPLVFQIPGIFRTGGLEVRRPGAIRYGDAIAA